MASLLPRAKYRRITVGIPNNTTMQDSASIQLVDTDKAFMINKVTTAQRDAILSPVSSMVVYNSTTSGIEYYDGAAWQSLIGGSGAGLGHLAMQPVATGAVQAVVNKIHPIDVSGGVSTVTPPPSPSIGDQFTVSDCKGAAATNNITVATTAQKFQGAAQNYVINVNGARATFAYVSAAIGWCLI